jgi:hypothetical protein
MTTRVTRVSRPHQDSRVKAQAGQGNLRCIESNWSSVTAALSPLSASATLTRQSSRQAQVR